MFWIAEAYFYCITEKSSCIIAPLLSLCTVHTSLRGGEQYLNQSKTNSYSLGANWIIEQGKEGKSLAAIFKLRNSRIYEITSGICCIWFLEMFRDVRQSLQFNRAGPSSTFLFN